MPKVVWQGFGAGQSPVPVYYRWETSYREVNLHVFRLEQGWVFHGTDTSNGPPGRHFESNRFHELWTDSDFAKAAALKHVNALRDEAA